MKIRMYDCGNINIIWDLQTQFFWKPLVTHHEQHKLTYSLHGAESFLRS